MASRWYAERDEFLLKLKDKAVSVTRVLNRKEKGRKKMMVKALAGRGRKAAPCCFDQRREECVY